MYLYMHRLYLYPYSFQALLFGLIFLALCNFCSSARFLRCPGTQGVCIPGKPLETIGKP